MSCRPITRALILALLASTAVLAGCGQGSTTRETNAMTPSASPHATATVAPRPTATISQPSVFIAVTPYVASGTGQTSIEALNSVTGAVQWRSRAYQGYYSFLHVADGMAYALISGTASNSLLAWRASTGDLLWQAHPQAAMYATMDSGIIFLSTPAYIGPNKHGLVAAYRATDGSLLWQYDAGACAAGEIAAGNGIVFVTANGCAQAMTEVALREQTGAVAWQQTPPYEQPGGAATIVGGVVYLNVYGVVCAYDATTGSHSWCYQPTTRYSQGDIAPEVTANAVYSANGQQFLALQPDNGRLLWKQAYRSLIGGLTATADAVYVAGGIDQAHNFAALSPSDGHPLWSTELFPLQLGKPLAANGVIYVNDTSGAGAKPEPGYLYALNAGDGSVLWKHTEDAATISAPVLG